MKYRDDLPQPIPFRIRARPISRGYPVPFFVARDPAGGYDFRVVDPEKLARAIRGRRCIICGEPLQTILAFIVGPIGALNRITSEAPAHHDCADWSIRACPFLLDRSTRRPAGLPESAALPAGGVLRNPGVGAVWSTRSTRLLQVEGSILFELGDPTRVEWWRAGVRATRSEVLGAFAGGLPEVRAAAALEGPDALKHLEGAIEWFYTLLPGDLDPAPVEAQPVE